MAANLKIAGESDPRERGSENEDLDEMGRQLWQTIGAVKLANGIASTLSSQAVRAMEKIRDEKLYLSEKGYTTFDQFCDNHPESPMSHDAFRRRVNLLQTEGDAVFDLLSSLNVPLSARKLLAGQVAINGNEIEIGDVKVRVDDEAAVKSLFRTVHSELLKQARINERGKKENEKHKRRIDQLQEEKLRGATVSQDHLPYQRALVMVLGHLETLKQECAKIEDPAEKKRFGLLALERLAQARNNLEAAALGLGQPTNATGLSDEDLQELLDAED